MITTAKRDICVVAKATGLKLYEIGEAINMKPSAFSLYLRRQLNETEKVRVFEVIKRLSDDKV